MRKKVAIGGIVIALLICSIVFYAADNDQKEAEASQNKQAIKTETSLPETTVSSPVPTTQTDGYSNVFSRTFGKWEVIETIGYGYICTADSSEDYVGGILEIRDDRISCDMPNDEYDYIINYPKFVLRWQSANDFHMERYATYESFNFEDDERVPLVEIKSKEETGFGTRFWIRDKNHIVIEGPQYFLAKKME